jgi:serine/threonine protein kinase
MSGSLTDLSEIQSAYAGGLRGAPLAQLLCADLERRWSAGHPVRVEQYLKYFPALAEQPQGLIDLIYAEFLRREQLGPPPTAEEYLERFPALADGLRRQFNVHALLCGEGTLSSDPTSGGPPGTLAQEPQSPQKRDMQQNPSIVLGEYEVLELLGQGGMGKVFKARQRRLDRMCALKVILPEHLKQPAALARFQREARAAARLDHPNIVRVYDAGEDRGVHFLAMEYLEGIDLAALLRQAGPLPVPLACEYMRQAALGLQHAHEQGLVHRDFKPSNVMLTRGGVVKVLDLGLAQVCGSTGDTTATGTVMGTADYLSPEQGLDAKHVDIRSDLYSLGCSLYHLLTGRVPFVGESVASKLLAHQMQEPTPVEELRGDLPDGLPAVVRKLMAKRKEDRFATPAAAAKALLPFGTRARQPSTGVPPVSCGIKSGAAVLGVQSTIASVKARDKKAPKSQPKRGKPDAFTLARVAREISSRTHPQRLSRPVLLTVTGMLLLAVALSCYLLRRDPDSGSQNQDKGPPPALASEPFDNDDLTNSIGMKFAPIPKGSFWMGGSGGKRGDDLVTIPYTFYLGVYEVTQQEWQAVMDSNPSLFKRNGKRQDKVKDFSEDDLKRFPVEMVSWKDAQTFIERLNAREKRTQWVYRLPTEVEWEYACRGGANSKEDSSFDFYLDKLTNNLSFNQANFDGNFPAGKGNKGAYLERPCKAGSYKPNKLGLYDMHGNVWEWCHDQEEEGKKRVVRGGSWFDSGENCRAAMRRSDPPNSTDGSLGLRLALVPANR